MYAERRREGSRGRVDRVEGRLKPAVLAYFTAAAGATTFTNQVFRSSRRCLGSRSTKGVAVGDRPP